MVEIAKSVTINVNTPNWSLMTESERFLKNTPKGVVYSLQKYLVQRKSDSKQTE